MRSAETAPRKPGASVPSAGRESSYLRKQPWGTFTSVPTEEEGREGAGRGVNEKGREEEGMV